jgi:hypothetical protein
MQEMFSSKLKKLFGDGGRLEFVFSNTDGYGFDPNLFYRNTWSSSSKNNVLLLLTEVSSSFSPMEICEELMNSIWFC